MTLDENTAIELNDGDLILFPHSSAYKMGDKRDSKCILQADFGKSIQSEAHSFNSDEETATLISVHLKFDTTCLHLFIKSLPELIHIKKLQQKEPQWLEQITRLIVEETANEKMGSKLLISRLSEVLIISYFLIRYCVYLAFGTR